MTVEIFDLENNLLGGSRARGGATLTHTEFQNPTYDTFMKYKLLSNIFYSMTKGAMVGKIVGYVLGKRARDFDSSAMRVPKQARVMHTRIKIRKYPKHKNSKNSSMPYRRKYKKRRVLRRKGRKGRKRTVKRRKGMTAAGVRKIVTRMANPPQFWAIEGDFDAAAGAGRKGYVTVTKSLDLTDYNSVVNNSPLVKATNNSKINVSTTIWGQNSANYATTVIIYALMYKKSIASSATDYDTFLEQYQVEAALIGLTADQTLCHCASPWDVPQIKNLYSIKKAIRYDLQPHQTFSFSHNYVVNRISLRDFASQDLDALRGKTVMYMAQAWGSVCKSSDAGNNTHPVVTPMLFSKKYRIYCPSAGAIADKHITSTISTSVTGTKAMTDEVAVAPDAVAGG